MSLADQIKDFYFERLADLPKDKRFHFASRVGAWTGDPRAIDELRELKSWVAPADLSAEFQKILDEEPGILYAKQLRQPFFAKYPTLFGIHNCLFRLRHLEFIYSINARKQFLSLVPKSELEELYRQIVSDDSALRVLSRFAVDYIYLYELLFETDSRYQPGRLLEIKQEGQSEEDLHLHIYLLTHAVIADSLFYARELPADRLPIYQRFVEELESLISTNYDSVRLDNKFEFLVVCRIVGYHSDLTGKISGEAQQAAIQEDYITEPRIGAADIGLNGFERSEHRNVLYIMSCSDYQPFDLKNELKKP